MSNTIVSKGMSTSLIYTETIRRLLWDGYTVILMDPKVEHLELPIAHSLLIGECATGK